MPLGGRPQGCKARDYTAMPAPQADMRESAKKRKKRAWAKAQKRLEQKDDQLTQAAANKTAKRQSLPFDDVVGPGDGDEEWSDVLDDEQLTQRCSPERTARSPSPSPSPEAVRSPQSGDGDEDWSGVLDDEQLTQRCSPKNAAELRHILAQGLVAVQERVATAAQAPAFAECCGKSTASTRTPRQRNM